jgi:hypothetical protein
MLVDFMCARSRKYPICGEAGFFGKLIDESEIPSGAERKIRCCCAVMSTIRLKLMANFAKSDKKIESLYP